MPFDPAKPATGSPQSSAEIRDQFNALKALLDAQTTSMDAMGAQIAGLNSQQSLLQAQVAELLPVGVIVAWPKSLGGMPSLPGTGTWVECNGQVLFDFQSPFNGQTLPNLNTAHRFLRGASVSGGTGGSESHTHTVNLQDNNISAVEGGSTSVPNSAEYITGPADHVPLYYEVVWVMRVR